MQKLLLLLAGLFLFSHCQSDKNTTNKFAFYHWKSKLENNSTEKEAFNTLNSNTLYLRYFDIKQVKAADYRNNGIFPVAVLKEVPSHYKDYNIIPVIFIQNEILKNKDLIVSDLADKINKLVFDISQDHFGKNFIELQLDCDWTTSTQQAFFELIKLLQTKYEISTTIRLHQIKYADKTGIPPVKKGALMVYNVGDLKNWSQNSILEATIVKQYITPTTTYPLQLDIALPLYSQAVLKNENDQIRLINHNQRTALEQAPDYFEQINTTQFKVKKDTLFKSMYLYEGYDIKLEEYNQDEVASSYKHIKNSNLNINNIIFYHLDETTLKDSNLETLISNLSK